MSAVEVIVCGQHFKLNKEEVECIGLIDNLCKDLNQEEPIKINSITSEIFKIILEYIDSKLAQKKEGWRDEYFAKYEIMLATILQVSQFLDVPDLCNEATKKIANRIKECKKPDEMNDKFKIEHNLSKKKAGDVIEKLKWTALK